MRYAADSFTEFDCLKKEQKGIRYLFIFFYTSTNGNICWNWKICNNDEHMLLKHEVIFYFIFIYWGVFHLLTLPPSWSLLELCQFFLWRTLTISRRWDEQTVRVRALLGLNSVCLIAVESSETWLVCGTIKKPRACVFLTTVTYHHLWLHWNNKKQTKVYFVNSCM